MNRRGFVLMAAGAMGDAILLGASPSTSLIRHTARVVTEAYPSILSTRSQPAPGVHIQKEPGVLPTPSLGNMTVEQALRCRQALSRPGQAQREPGTTRLQRGDGAHMRRGRTGSLCLPHARQTHDCSGSE